MMIRSTTPSPTSSASRRSSYGCSRRSWVAQAVESARSTSWASSKVSTSQWSASWSPTISRQRPTTPPMLTGALQPRSVTSLSTIGPSSCGSRRDGAEPLPGLPRPGPSRLRRRPDPGAVRRRPLAAALARARASACRAAVDASSRSSSPGWSSVTGVLPLRGGPAVRRDLSVQRDLPVGDGEASTGELGGDVLGHGRGDEDLFGVPDHPGEPLAPTYVELGEHVIEDEHRVLVVLPQHLVGSQPQREGEGPRLPVAGIALGR